MLEAGLEEIMRRHAGAGALTYTTDFGLALEGAELVFLALDTSVREDDSPDLGQVYAAAVEVGRGLSGDVILCVSAQVPVGTCERIAALVNENAGGWRCTMAYVPEFLRLGSAIDTFVNADRFVIGCDDAETARRVASLYEPLGRPIVVMDVRSAEMVKHASNAFLATSISFANEIANLCEASGADVDEVVRALKLDRRIGPHAFLSAGMGFAGGTLGRDVRALQQLGGESGNATPLMDAVMDVNTSRGAVVGARLREEYGELRGLRIAVLGLTYKPGTSTLRRSIAIDVIAELVGAGVEVRACDPHADFSDAPDLPDFAMREDALAAAEGADAVVLLTEWPALRELDLGAMRRRMRGCVLLDARNFFEADAAARAGLRHVRIGRGVARGVREAAAATYA